MVRKGARKGRRTIVVHAHVDSSMIRVSGPRFGLGGWKGVGVSVSRPRGCRRLRHIAADVVGELDPEFMVVIRANPASATATHDELASDLRSALEAASSRARGTRS